MQRCRPLPIKARMSRRTLPPRRESASPFHNRSFREIQPLTSRRHLQHYQIQKITCDRPRVIANTPSSRISGFVPSHNHPRRLRAQSAISTWRSVGTASDPGSWWPARRLSTTSVPVDAWTSVSAQAASTAEIPSVMQPGPRLHNRYTQNACRLSNCEQIVRLRNPTCCCNVIFWAASP